MKPLCCSRLLLCLLLTVPLAALAQDEQAGDDVDRLSLAALLIGDGNHDRARAVLAAVDPQDPELDRVRYHSLEGLVSLELDEPAAAVAAFERAVEAADANDEAPPEVIWLYLAQSHFALDNHREVISALERADSETTDVPSVYLMRSQSHWSLGEIENAWRVLAEGRQRFPDRAGDFIRRQVFFLVDQSLYQQAAEIGRAFIDTGEASPNDAVAIGNALRQAGQFDEALKILETARLSDPDNVRLAKVLAHTWMARDQLLPAANILREAAVYDPELTSEAAELYKRSGWLMQALMLNSQVIDQEKKLKQRLAIFIELERFDQAAGMEEALVRNGLLGDENIRYALAYAYFKTGAYDRAEQHLAQLTDDELFRKAAELRRAMEQCADESWLCG